MTSKKTDNAHLKVKLDLRRRFLAKYHAAEPPAVIDCCQGGGVLWRNLRAEFPLRSYFPMDVKPKKGRLKIDSTRVLAQPGWSANVIDVDTYGSPWKHWTALLPNVKQATTVFLTIGLIRMGGGGPLDLQQREWLGLGTLDVPPAIQAQLHDFSFAYCLSRAGSCALRIIEAVEALADGHARYVGVRLEPIAPS